MSDEPAPETEGNGIGAAGEAPAESGRASEFERYALLAALTLVVLCLLIWDRWQDRPPFARDLPPPDRTLRVQLGGAQPGPAKPAAGADERHESIDPPPPPPAPPSPPSRRTYVVRDGDTLSGIARRELGSASRAGEIAELNHLADPSKLKIGVSLELPAK